jgi:hypothetical protein
MLRNPVWGVSSCVVLLLPALLLATGCNDGDALPGAGPPPDGGAPASSAVAANGLVSGGTVMHSPRYRLIGSMSPGVADGTVGASTRFVLRSGLVGASQ